MDYSAIKRNKRNVWYIHNVDTFQNRWVKSQAPLPPKKTHNAWFHLCKVLKNGNKLIVTESKALVACGWGGGKHGLHRGKKTLLGVMENALIVPMVSWCVHMSKRIKFNALNTSSLLHFNWTSLNICMLWYSHMSFSINTCASRPTNFHNFTVVLSIKGISRYLQQWWRNIKLPVISIGNRVPGPANAPVVCCHTHIGREC